MLVPFLSVPSSSGWLLHPHQCSLILPLLPNIFLPSQLLIHNENNRSSQRTKKKIILQQKDHLVRTASSLKQINSSPLPFLLTAHSIVPVSNISRHSLGTQKLWKQVTEPKWVCTRSSLKGFLNVWIGESLILVPVLRSLLLFCWLAFSNFNMMVFVLTYHFILFCFILSSGNLFFSNET